MIVTRGLGRGGLGALVALGLAVTGTTPPIVQPWDLSTRLIVDYGNFRFKYSGAVTLSVVSGGVLLRYSGEYISLLPRVAHKVLIGAQAEVCVDAGLNLSGPGSARLILV